MDGWRYEGEGGVVKGWEKEKNKNKKKKEKKTKGEHTPRFLLNFWVHHQAEVVQIHSIRMRLSIRKSDCLVEGALWLADNRGSDKGEPSKEFKVHLRGRSIQRQVLGEFEQEFKNSR